MPLPTEYLPATKLARQDLVLLHGWGCNREVWRPLLVLLRPWANITLVDLPGCAPGLDASQTPVLPALVTEILHCMPARSVVIGWSLGGQIALELAERAPQRVMAVATICTNPRFVADAGWPGMPAPKLQTFYAGAQRNPATAMQRFDTLQVAGAQQPRQLLRHLQRLSRPPASAALLQGLQWLKNLDKRPSLTRLRQPQLHLLAGKDALVPVAVMPEIATLLQHKPAARVELLPQASHLAPLDSPMQLEQCIGQLVALTPPLPVHTATCAEPAKQEVAASFSRAAAAYDSAAHLQQDVGKQLLTYLDKRDFAPATVLDLGCGTGYFYPQLQQRYAAARYVGLDLAFGMARWARTRHGAQGDWLVADAEALPLRAESVDLVFSSLALQWCYRPQHVFAELARVLRPGGVCVFTSLGPQTLYELRAAWAAVDAHQHVNAFLPGAELAAALARVPGVQLTLERRTFTLQYERVGDLLHELKALGAHNMNPGRASGLTSRRSLQGMLQAYEARRAQGLLPASYEVYFGVVEKA